MDPDEDEEDEEPEAIQEDAGLAGADTEVPADIEKRLKEDKP